MVSSHIQLTQTLYFTFFAKIHKNSLTETQHNVQKIIIYFNAFDAKYIMEYKLIYLKCPS